MKLDELLAKQKFTRILCSDINFSTKDEFPHSIGFDNFFIET
jgi:hypothetical protein